MNDRLRVPDRERLASWLSDALNAAIRADALTFSTPSGGGWSNETWLVDLAPAVASGSALPSRVVLRLQPDRRSMFPRYDLGRQVVCLDVLGSEPDVPTPEVLGRDLAGDRLGRPGFLMQFVAGRTPSDDHPTFAEAGWLAEASRDQQREFHIGMIDALAALHRVDPEQEALGDRLGLAPTGCTNRAAFEDLREIWEFDRGERWPASLDAVIDLLEQSIPEPTARCLLWGDARPANVVVASNGFRPVALLDWELATIGTPELEITWMAEMNRLRMEGAGLPRLAGFLDDDEAAAHYEARSGRTLAGLTWYRSFSALRVAVLMHRYLRAMVHADRLPVDHRLLSDTVACRRVLDLVER